MFERVPEELEIPLLIGKWFFCSFREVLAVQLHTGKCRGIGRV